MTNFRDPAVVAKDGCTYGLSLVLEPRKQIHLPLTLAVASVKLWHVVDGIFM